MESPKVLSGHVIVAKGVTKLDASLPEIGLKDIIPNGSWLEQKQIQSALEARKHLIEVERIDKIGTLSHATWRDDLKLAEVTQKAGGYWKYLGHNIGMTLYLRPEEVLFLMEVNCLLLQHNNLTVSLQKAYSLLLNEITITQYRVYASLSRLGYKILRHKGPTNIKKECSPLNHADQTDRPKNLDYQVMIDNNVDNHITDQSDTSLLILDSETNAKSFPRLNTENLNQIEPANEFTEKQQNISSVEENSGRADNNQSMTVTQSAIKTDNNELTTKQIQENKEEGKDTDYINKQNDDVTIQKVEKINEVTSAKDKTDITMAVLQNEILECKTINNTSEIDKIKQYEEGKVRTESLHNVIYTASTINDAVTANRSDTDNIIAKDDTQETENSYSVKCVESMNDTFETCIADSNIQSIEKDGADDNSALTIEINNMNLEVNMDLDTPHNQDISSSNFASEMNNTNKIDSKISAVHVSRDHQMFLNYVTRLKKLTSRQIKPCNYKIIANIFDNIPDLFKKEIVTINVPDEKYIPKNVFVNNTTYVLNMNQIKTKCIRSSSVESSAYNNIDEVNANHIRRIRNNSNNEFNQNLQFSNDIRFAPRQTLYFRPFNFWRPHTNPNCASYNMFFQRPSFPNIFHSRFQYQARPYPFLRMFSYPNNINMSSGQSNTNNIRKRSRGARAIHLQSIRNLALRLKQLIMSGNIHSQNIQSLHRLLFAFNNKYKTRLRLNKDFEIVNDENIVETIEIDEDDEPRSKKRKISQDSGKFDENLSKLRQLALKLKDLEVNNKSSPKHKRALSKAVKTFNKSYDADIYMNKDYEIIDKRFINLDSDSEPECTVTETNDNVKKKKLKNPFYILKQRSEKQTEAIPGTSKENVVEELNASNVESTTNNKYCALTSNTFSEGWLPHETDFGRAEVIKKNVINSRFVDAVKDEYLYSFMKDRNDDFNNWLEAKLAFLQHIEETEVAFQSEQDEILNIIKEPANNSGILPLVNSDCPDTASVLEKLRIIRNNNTIDVESELCVHFDVYNRDVQNFKKTNLPKPHFRIICMEESTKFPSAAEVMALHSKYDDNVAIVFAVAGISSFSYLQINPIDLPVYVDNSGSGLE